eukprot:660285-Alexandrium_andersonii.AAC.1
MSASLVGSEMCIRDSAKTPQRASCRRTFQPPTGQVRACAPIASNWCPHVVPSGRLCRQAPEHSGSE